MGNADSGARVVDRRRNWEARVEMMILKRPTNELSAYDKLVYTILCGHANRDGNATLYVRTIAEEASCSERQARRALSTLEARHLLVRRPQITAGQGQTFNLYEVYGFDEYSFDGNPSEGSDAEPPCRSDSTPLPDSHATLPDSHASSRRPETTPLPDSNTPACRSVTPSLSEGQAPPDSQAEPINVFEQLLFNSSKREHLPPAPQGGGGGGENFGIRKPKTSKPKT